VTQVGRSQSNIDLLTVGSIAVVAYCLSNFIHEGLGHGGVCLIAGGKPIALTSTFFEYDESKTSLLTQRWIAAGGSLMNLVTGAIALGMLRSATKASLRYFLWLFSLVSFLMAFGYFLFSGVSGVGDWVWWDVSFGLVPYVRDATTGLRSSRRTPGDS
jgi:hypothetical protein